MRKYILLTLILLLNAGAEPVILEIQPKNSNNIIPNKRQSIGVIIQGAVIIVIGGIGSITLSKEIMEELSKQTLRIIRNNKEVLWVIAASFLKLPPKLAFDAASLVLYRATHQPPYITPPDFGVETIAILPNYNNKTNQFLYQNPKTINEITSDKQSNNSNL